MKSKKFAMVDNYCVACGTCMKVCRIGAINVYKGVRAIVDDNKCVGCGMCKKECQANAISIKDRA